MPLSHLFILQSVLIEVVDLNLNSKMKFISELFVTLLYSHSRVSHTYRLHCNVGSMKQIEQEHEDKMRF